MRTFCIFVLFISVNVCAINIKLKKQSTLYLPYTYENGGPKYELLKTSVEQLAYDPDNTILYTVGDTVLHAVDLSDPDNMTVLSYLEYPGMEFTDIEFCGGHLFTAIDNRTKRSEGKAMVFSTYDRTTKQMKELNRIPVGAVPDMVKPTSDCTRLLVAVEGEAYEYPPDHITDPPGFVAIIDFSNGIDTHVSVRSLGFKAYDNKVDSLRASGVRHVYQENNNPFSNDVEPEYIAINDDNTLAYITLQENNAIAVVDLQKYTVVGLYGLGFKNWSSSLFDASDKDGGAHLNHYTVQGIYQPDSIVYFKFKGVEYLAMANEGDSKDYKFGKFRWTEEARGDDLAWKDLFNIDFTTKEQLQNKTLLGRLRVSSSQSGIDDGGFYRAVYTYGGRSWSIRRADNISLVYDSGDDISVKTNTIRQDLFNDDIDDKDDPPFHDFDKRSDNKGAETEELTIGEIGGSTVFFVANERPGTIFVYSVDSDISSPVFQDFYSGIPNTRNKSWEQMFQERTLSEIDPEDIKKTTVVDLHGLVFKNWSSSLFDPSDKGGGAHLNHYVVQGIYQPDPTVYFKFKGVEYLTVANEGVSKDYEFGKFRWTEEARGDDLARKDLFNIDFTTKEQLQNKTLLGRLRVSTSQSGIDDGGFYRAVYTHGGRGWTIRRADNMSLVYDSGDDISVKTNTIRQDLFNDDIDDKDDPPFHDFDKRSDNKGAETEHITVGEIGGSTAFFVASERPGAIFVYSVDSDISSPVFQDFYSGIPDTRNKSWEQMFQERTLSEMDPEDVQFFPDSKSPTGGPVLIAGGSVSGTVSIIRVETS